MSYVETAASFGLYGESVGAPEPGFVHIEDVAARSRALDWRIDSHRHANLFQVLCIYKGQSEVQFDDEVHELSRGAVITVPPGVVHAFRFEPGTQGTVLTIADQMLRDDNQMNYVGSLIEAPKVITFEAQGAAFGQLHRNLDTILTEFAEPRTGRHLILTALVKIVLTLLIRQLEDTRLSIASGPDDSRMLTGFRKLIEKNYPKQWSVAEYASALNTSVSSLNRRCHRYVGLTAKTIIRNRVLLEAKRKLIYTREPIESVAYSLGFNDPGYFSRFFSKSTGMPPGEYRRSAAALH